MLTRRDFGKLALAGLPAATVLGRVESIFGAIPQARPNSLVAGVQVGVITYSYRSMPDQSAEATLKYVVDSGISAIELMGGPGRELCLRAGDGWRRRPRSCRWRSWRRAGLQRHSAAAPVSGAPVTPQKRLPRERGMASRVRRPQVAAAVAAVGARGDMTPEQAGGAAEARRRTQGVAASSRWTSSRRCARCTTTPASPSTRARASPNMSDEEFE